MKGKQELEGKVLFLPGCGPWLAFPRSLNPNSPPRECRLRVDGWRIWDVSHVGCVKNHVSCDFRVYTRLFPSCIFFFEICLGQTIFSLGWCLCSQVLDPTPKDRALSPRLFFSTIDRYIPEP